MNKSTNPLHDVTVRILEDWAMMLVEDSSVTPELFEKDKPFIFSSIEFSGEFNGIIGITFQKPFIVQIARNVLGISEDQEPSAAEINDAAAELANVVTGNFLTEAYGEDLAFKVVAPRIREVQSHSITQLFNGPQCCCVTGDGIPVVTSMTVKE